MSRQTGSGANPYAINIPRAMATRPTAPPFSPTHEYSHGYPPLHVPPPPYTETVLNVHERPTTPYATDSQAVLIVPVRRYTPRQLCCIQLGSLVIGLIVAGIVYAVVRSQVSWTTND